MRHISIVVAVIGCGVHSAFAGRTMSVSLPSPESQKKKDDGLAPHVFAVLPITYRGYRDQWLMSFSEKDVPFDRTRQIIYPKIKTCTPRAPLGWICGQRRWCQSLHPT